MSRWRHSFDGPRTAARRYAALTCLTFEPAEIKHFKMPSVLASDSSRGIHLARQILRIKLRPIAPDGEENSG